DEAPQCAQPAGHERDRDLCDADADEAEIEAVNAEASHQDAEHAGGDAGASLRLQRRQPHAASDADRGLRMSLRPAVRAELISPSSFDPAGEAHARARLQGRSTGAAMHEAQAPSWKCPEGTARPA